jgi:hypothetical protein
MISVVLRQLLLIRLKTIAVVCLNHSLERRRRVCQDVCAGLVHRQIRRDCVLVQVTVLYTNAWVPEREEAAVRVGCVVRIILDPSAEGT